VDLSKELNPEQFEAASWPGGPLLILAGAGSGKTRVLIHRVLWLAAEAGIDPGNVLAVTFTNKAAAEMRTRLGTHIGADRARRTWFHTFHGACLRILRAEIEERLPGFTRDFTIYDDDDQAKVVKAAMAKAGVSETFFPPRAVLSRIHDAKNKMISPSEFATKALDFTDEAVAKVYPLYQRELVKNNAVDFDDIILLTVRLFTEHHNVLEGYHRKLKHILVDEYQDTNRAQYELIRLLASGHRNLACVGDDDQGIYAWRGADIQNILDFQKDYPDAKVVKLVRNYRSTKTILRAAMGVITRNRGRYGKELWTENATGEPVHVYEASHERDEAKWICDEVGRLTAGTRRRREMAIFYRTNAQSRVLEDALRNKGLPYRLVGALRFFDRAEIKDVLSYLKAILNPADGVALGRILNVPSRGIGDTTVDKIEAFAASKNLTFGEALDRVGEVGAGLFADGAGALGEIKGGTRKKIADFVKLIASLREDSKAMSPAAFLRKLVEESGYMEWLKRPGNAAEGDDPGARVENVGQLIASASELSAENPNATPRDFLDKVLLVSDVDDLDQTADAITLMTFHAAKGLEFPVVFMTGMEEGIFPHSRTLEGDGASVTAIEEERRLCYVGMTRAREVLYLTYARERATWNSRRPLGPSRFLSEAPADALERVRGGNPWDPPANARREPRYDEFDQSPAYDDDAAEPPGRTASGGYPMAGPRSAPPTPIGAWKRGMRIVHTQFGEGRIEGVEGGGANAKLTVLFERGGVRKLLLRYAGKDIRPAD